MQAHGAGWLSGVLRLRERIDMDTPIMKAMIMLAEGNPGAVTVLGQMLSLQEPSGVALMLHLEDMNMRGPQIWVAYKDWAEGNMERLAGAIIERNQEMIDKVNEQCYLPDHGYNEKAVRHLDERMRRP